jgi:pimeloyl-ACP methyl ester carboxylesterase
MTSRFVMLVALILLQCGERGSDKTQTENNKDMKSTVDQNSDNRIKGPQGFLYVLQNESVSELPIVFAHSFGGSSEQWRNQIRHFGSDHKVVAFDFRSHGKSEVSTPPLYAAEALAGDIAAVVDSLDLHHFILVGHSMGGAASIAYSSANPDKVAGLVLVGTPGKTPEQQSSPVIASLESDKYQMVMDQYMKGLLNDANPATESAVMEGIKKISKETSISIIKALFEFDPLPAFASLKMPILIISTSREKAQPNSLMNQMPKLPNRVFEQTSHWIQMDKPQEFNKALEEFVKNVESNSLIHN